MEKRDAIEDGSEVAFDLLVVGAGMAGLTAAGWAAEHGLRVMVVERDDEIGGSAVLSGGAVWTVADFEEYRRLNPNGQADRGRVLVDEFERGLDWVRGTGARVGPTIRFDGVFNFRSTGSSTDIYEYLHRARRIVERNGGIVVTGAEPVRLLVEGGTVVGATVRDRDGSSDVPAKHVLLASGGFQGDPELRGELIGDYARGLTLRANPNSRGDGLRLARSVGAAVSPRTSVFYAHVMAYPLPTTFGPRDFLRLAQFYSPRAVLLDTDGQRFVDDSVSYYRNASAIAQQPTGRALLVADDQVRQWDLGNARDKAQEVIDRVADAQGVGAHVAVGSMDEVAAAAAEWGYQNVAAAIADFNADMADDQRTLQPPRSAHRRPFEPPFYVMEVTSAITFTFRGIATDADCHVLDEQGRAVPGLLVAGADAGGLYDDTYCGGLAMGLVFGLRAARTAQAEMAADPATQT